MMQHAHLFEPLQIGPLTAKNRIEIAPATPYLAGHDGSFTPELQAYVSSLAASGAAIMTMGVMKVDPQVKLGARSLCAGSDLFIPDLDNLANAIHEQGALAGAELVYSRYMLTPGEKVVSETSTEDVEEIIERFVQATARLCKCGFDLVLIHGGHGNVPSMFFNPLYNHRTDRFGGSFEGRCRFGVELLQAVREACKGKMAIEYRISAEEILPGMATLEETLAYAKVIEPYIDLLHVSRGLLEKEALLPVINPSIYQPKAPNLPYAKRFKEELSIPVSVVGAFDLDLAEKAVAQKDVDMVSMIRTIYADTRCVEKARLGKASDIRPCIRCNSCISRTHSEFKTVRCAVNPVVGRELHVALARPISQRKNVIVVGGGPAGLEAARVLSARGHAVTLIEKEAQLGGLLRLAGQHKPELSAYLDWAIAQVENDCNIQVELGVKATPELLATRNLDAVIVAIGATPVIPLYTNASPTKVIWVGDLARDDTPVGQKVAVAGSGVTGMETALFLAQAGKQVTLVGRRPLEQMGRGASAINLISLKQLLAEAQVELRCGCEVLGVNDEGIVVCEKQGASATIPCETVILSLGFTHKAQELAALEHVAPLVKLIGDCSGKGGTIFNATQTAFDAAMSI